MNAYVYPLIFLVGWISLWVIRIPYIRQSLKMEGTEYSSGRFDQFLVFLLFLGTTFIPLVYIFTPWLDFADYTPPSLISIICIGFILLGLVILRKAHIDLGGSYSQDLEIKEEHVLITVGIYKYIRHPMYAAGFLISIAQIGLLQNWIAGFSGVIVLSFFYILRVPVEEEMMIKTFGEDYLSYRRQTKRLIPFI